MLAASGYTVIGILILAAIGMALAILAATHIVGPRKVGRVKQSTYESGMEPVGDTRRRFHVRFYLIAVLFLIFDVEVNFFIPWASIFGELSAAGRGDEASPMRGLVEAGYGPGYVLIGMGVFFALLLVGFYYEWRRGVFKWN